MNKTEYLSELSYKLRRLPSEEVREAISYFSEYFDDAGIENEQAVIQSLGSPDEVAKQIISECAIKSLEQKPTTVKDSMSTIWVVMLAIFAAPFALPVSILIAIFAVCVIFTVVIFALSLLFSTIILVALGIISIAIGIVLLFINIPSSFLTLGLGFILTSIGILTTYCVFLLSKYLVLLTSKLLKKLIHNGTRRNVYENEKSY